MRFYDSGIPKIKQNDPAHDWKRNLAFELYELKNSSSQGVVDCESETRKVYLNNEIICWKFHYANCVHRLHDTWLSDIDTKNVDIGLQPNLHANS